MSKPTAVGGRANSTQGQYKAVAIQRPLTHDSSLPLELASAQHSCGINSADSHNQHLEGADAAPVAEPRTVTSTAPASETGVAGNHLGLPEELLNVQQAAKILGISPKTLRDHVLHRRIDYVKVFGRVLFRPETLWDLIERHTVRARVQ